MKKAVGLMLFLTMLFTLVACKSDDVSGPDAGVPVSGGDAADVSAPPLQPEDLPDDHVYPFQSKTKVLDGIAIGNDIYIPFIEFVEDMGYTYTIEGNTVTVHNTDHDVDHILEIDSATVTTGDAQGTMFGALQYVEKDGENVLYVPTQLFSIFDGDFDLSQAHGTA